MDGETLVYVIAGVVTVIASLIERKFKKAIEESRKTKRDGGTASSDARDHALEEMKRMQDEDFRQPADEDWQPAEVQEDDTPVASWKFLDVCPDSDESEQYEDAVEKDEDDMSDSVTWTDEAFPQTDASPALAAEASIGDAPASYFQEGERTVKKRSCAFGEETPQKKTEKINPKKLLLYSEIMKPKYSE